MNWVDVSVFLVLVIGTVLGFISGLLWQVARLVIFGISCYATLYFHQPVATWLGQRMSETSPTVLKGLAYFLTFVGVYLVLFLIVVLIERAMKAAELKPIDRVFGGVLGLVKAGLVCGVVLLGIVVIPIQAFTPEVEQSRLGPPVLEATRTVLLAIPEEQKKKVGEWFEAIKKRALERAREAGAKAGSDAVHDAVGPAPGNAPPPANESSPAGEKDGGAK